jgi:hypothetical protein
MLRYKGTQRHLSKYRYATVGMYSKRILEYLAITLLFLLIPLFVYVIG